MREMRYAQTYHVTRNTATASMRALFMALDTKAEITPTHSATREPRKNRSMAFEEPSELAATYVPIQIAIDAP